MKSNPLKLDSFHLCNQTQQDLRLHPLTSMFGVHPNQPERPVKEAVNFTTSMG